MDEVVTTHDGKDYTEEQLFHLTNEIKDYQILHGSLLKMVEYETESSVAARPVGVSVLPTPFPERCFGEAMELQTIFNELYMRVSDDSGWLFSVLGDLMEHDALVSALWKVYLRVKEGGSVQKNVCAVFRSDYMLHEPSPGEESSLKQVEFNTFSCAGIAHAERVAKMHHHLARLRSPSLSDDKRLPSSQNTEAVASILMSAYKKYTSMYPSSKSGRPIAVLMPVQPFNFNIADERPIELALSKAGIPCYRCEWRSALSWTTLQEDRTLLFRPTIGPKEVEIAVVYYRAGYAAEEYREQGMEARTRFELSKAIKCPDILTNITNFKAVQSALCRPGALERFIPAASAAKIRKTFMWIQVLDSSPEGLEARKIATDPVQCLDYVLKPNLEGGGHNIYRSDIPDFLKEKPEESWHKYVLMRLITPPETTGTLMMPQDLYHGEIVSELGLWGTCLWERKGDGGDTDGLEIVENKAAGWTFKSKPQEIDEMSVVKGYGCFDCPLLFD